MSDFSAAEFAGRISRLQNVLADKDVDLAIVTQNSDLYYYTGSIQPQYLLVPAAGDPVVFARKAIEQIRKESPHITLEPFTGSKDFAAIMARYTAGSAKRVGLTLDTITYASVLRLQKILGQAELVDISWDVRLLRAVKSEAEVALQAHAGKVLAGVPQVLKESFQPGMTELQLAVEIERYLRLNECSPMIRSRREGMEMSGFGIVSSGVNTLTGTKFEGICGGAGVTPAVPHGASVVKIEKHVPVLIDFAFNYKGYHTDQTRMFCWGTPPDQVMKAYEAMIKVEDAVIASIAPGRVCEDIYYESAELAAELGYAEEYMGLGSEKVKFVGHGVGLELDEPPFLAAGMKDVLAEGMVGAVEPKVALPGVGIVGPEDTLVVRSGGAERLTPCSREFVVFE